MATVMLVSLNRVIIKISSEYAERNAVSSSEALSAHIEKEIGLMSKAANSSAVYEWLADEFDEMKKARAFDELLSIVGELYSYNLYVGVESSLNEYKVDDGLLEGGIKPAAVLVEGNPDDEWFFNCLRSDSAYSLSVDFDDIAHRKRVFIDYKVERNGVTLGVICTGLDFAHVAGELFSHYRGDDMRGLIIDKNGIILMDSSLMRDNAFLASDAEAPVRAVLADPAAIAAVNMHLSGIDGFWAGPGETVVADFSSGPHRFMTISPIRFTNWSVVILSGSTTLFDMTYFFPIILTILALLIAFAVTTNAVNYRLVFLPLSKLEQSLTLMRESKNAEIYGTERNDELGDLSKTIQDLFTKANVDALTGIYNRRFMENNLDRIMGLLSRGGSLLSVLMLDIDFFKKYNDAFGHDQGDVCLKAVARALADSVTRTDDFVVRYGGEEFAAILPNTDEDGARKVAEKLIENVWALNIAHPENAASSIVTVSVGVTTGQVTFKHSWDVFLKRADEALYMSKDNGRNQYTFLEFK